MKHIFLGLLILVSSTAKAGTSVELLEGFLTFATRDLINFGAPKETVLNLTASNTGLFVLSGNVIVGNSEFYERCLGTLDKDDLKLSCHDGVTAVMDVCRLNPAVCESERIKQKLREIYLDPNVVTGETMRGLGSQRINPYMHGITELAKKYPAAKKAIAKSMQINGCTSVELGDIEGQTIYMDQQALADDETNKVYEGAINRFRANLKCRSASVGVYLDVTHAVKNGKVQLSVVPIKAVEDEPVLLDTLEPVLDKPAQSAAATY